MQKSRVANSGSGCQNVAQVDEAGFVSDRSGDALGVDLAVIVSTDSAGSDS